MKPFLASLFPAAIGLVVLVVFLGGPLWMTRAKREELCEEEEEEEE